MHGDAGAALNQLSEVTYRGDKCCAVSRNTEIRHRQRDELNVRSRARIRLALETQFDILVIAQQRHQHADIITCQGCDVVVQPVATSRSRRDEQ